MRSKIRCDKKSYKILEFWMQLSESEVSPGVMDVLADGTAKPAPRTAPCRKKLRSGKKPRPTDASPYKAKCRWGEDLQVTRQRHHPR